MTARWCRSLLLLVLLGGAAARCDVVLVQDARPYADIVVADSPAPCVPYAAEELQTHVEKMTGARLPIVAESKLTESGRNRVLLGESGLTRRLGITSEGLRSDGFHLVARDGAVAIVGNDASQFSLNYDHVPSSAGTLYGVYRLLNDLGVRWFYPGEVGTVVPSLRDIRIADSDLKDAPHFPYRFGGYGKDLFAWRRRLGCGGDRDPWSTRHTFNQTVPLWKKYSETRPGCFRQRPDGTIVDSIALGHTAAIETAIEEARAFFASDRPGGKKYFLVIPADGLGHCYCPDCLARLVPAAGPRGELSNIVAEAVVQVAAALRDEFPNGRIVYCAYSNYYLPPTTVSRFPSNVVLLFAQPRSGCHDEKRRDEARDALRQWLKLRPEAIYFCRYYGSLQTLTPSFMPHLIADDIGFMKSLGEESGVPVGGEMNFAALPADSPYSWWHHLNQYVTAKLLWDPEQSVDELLDDYCTRFCGPGAMPMRRFWDRCEELYLDDEQRELYSVETIDELDAHLTAAQAAVESTPFAERLAFIDHGFEGLRALRRKLASSTASVDVDPDDGLVFHFTFEQPLEDGGSVSDRTGSTTGKVVGGTQAPGKTGSGVELSGDGSGVRITPVSLANTDYTIEAWVRPSKPLFKGTYFVVGPYAWDRHGLKIVDGRLWLWHRTTDPKWSGHQRLGCAGPPGGFIPGVWTHVAGTFSQQSGMALYVNGQLRGLNLEKKRPSIHAIHNLGASGGDELTDCFPGVIDEVKVYRRELSAAEVRLEYERGVPGN